MIKRTSYYVRNNSVITQFSKHYCISNILCHFRSIFQVLRVITPLVRTYFGQQRTSYYASEFPLDFLCTLELDPIHIQNNFSHSQLRETAFKKCEKKHSEAIFFRLDLTASFQWTIFPRFPYILEIYQNAFRKNYEAQAISELLAFPLQASTEVCSPTCAKTSFNSILRRSCQSGGQCIPPCKNFVLKLMCFTPAYQCQKRPKPHRY